MKILTVAICLLFFSSAAFAVPSEAEFARSFKCPEALPSDEARAEAVNAFVEWVSEAHPDWTIEKVVAFRMQLLTEYGCRKTLAQIKEQSKKPS